MADKDLSEIFEKEPNEWDFQGDRSMWLDMKEDCSGKELPLHEYAIAEMVCRKFEDISGVPLTYDAKPYVERYAHGGMSTGRISGLFWIARGLVQLIQNFHDAVNSHEEAHNEGASLQQEQKVQKAAPERPAGSVPGWVERFAAEYPEHRWTIQGLAAHGWTEQQLRSWLERLKG